MDGNLYPSRPEDVPEEPNRFLKSAVAALTALILVLTLFSLPAESYLFTAAPYQQALKSEGVYRRLPDRLASLAASGGGLDLPWANGLNVFQYFNHDQYRELFSMYLPEEWVQAQADGVLERSWDFANLKSDHLSLPLDLTTPKSRLAGIEGAQTAKLIVSSWPDCSLDDIAKIGIDIASGTSQNVPLCNPPQEMRPAFENTIGLTLQVFASAVPDSVDLVTLAATGKATGVDPDQRPDLAATDAYRFYRLGRAFLRVLPLIFLGLLIGLAVLTAMGPARKTSAARDVFSWLAQPLVIGGIAGLVSAIILAVSMNLIAEQMIFQLIAGAGQFGMAAAASAQESGMITDLARVLGTVGNRYLMFVSLLGVVTTAIGIGFGFLSRITDGKK
jgi:hypothetical protein